MEKIAITIGILATLTASSLVYDDFVLTDAEIQEVRDTTDFTPNEDFIFKVILLDKKNVEFDLSKITKKQVDDILMGTMLKLGIKQQDLIDKVMRGENINFDREIAKRIRKKTSLIRSII